MANSLFVEGLIENNIDKLIAAPKSDLHNHSTKGCSLSWVEKRTGHSLPRPPKTFDGLEETQTLFSGKPTEEEFNGSCSEFWWVLKTFAEYTLRKELPAAMFYLNNPVRDMLNKMIRWHIYLKVGKPVDMGILDSNMEKLLEEEYFRLYEKTYPNADYDSIWKAYYAVVKLWSGIGRDVAENLGFHYPDKAELDMLEFIENIKNKKL